MAPRVEGEELALRRAYESAGVSPDTVDLVEAHGTGTPVGDLVEIQALTRVFGPRSGDLPRVAVGSAKSMVSHLIQAAGIAGLIKAALSVYHKVLPPTLHCDNPRPELEMRKTPFYINSETRPWIHGPAAPRRAGVSSFGFGGVDTHVVLEEAPGANAGPGLSRPWETEVFVVRGESRAALIAAGERLQRAASRGDGAALHDLAFSVNSELLDGGLRLAVVAGSLEDLKRKLAYALDRVRDERCSRIEDRSGIFFFERPLAREGSVAFLFPGESSQYVNMLSDLCVSFPEARAQFDRLDRLFLENRHPILPSQLLFPPPTAEPDEIAAVAGRLWEIEYAVGCVFAADRALYDILKGLEIAPHAVTGHSCGEYAALLIASGVVDIRSEEQLDGYTRELARIHDASRHLVPSAKLLTVALQDRDAILRAVSESGGELSIAMDNCPHQVILCGPDAAIGAAQEKLQALGALCTLLPFEQAYHTPHYRPVCEQYVPFFASLPIVPSPTVLYSCTTTEPCEQTSEVIRKVAGEQWSLPVRFRETIERMHRDGVRIFVEVGPRGNLTSFVDDILKGSDYAAVASNMANRSATTQINHMVGLLAAHGVHMKLDHLYVNRSPRRVDLDESQAAGIGKAGREIKLIFELPYLDASPTMLSAAAAAAASAASADRPDSAAPAAPAPTPARGASASVMVEYMKTMQGFLDMNSELALALARRKNGKRDGDAGQNGRAGGA